MHRGETILHGIPKLNFYAPLTKSYELFIKCLDYAESSTGRVSDYKINIMRNTCAEAIKSAFLSRAKALNVVSNVVLQLRLIY